MTAKKKNVFTESIIIKLKCKFNIRYLIVLYNFVMGFFELIIVEEKIIC